MKKIAILAFFLSVVQYAGFANGIYSQTNTSDLEIYTQGRVASFKGIPSGTNIANYKTTRTAGEQGSQESKTPGQTNDRWIKRKDEEGV